MGQGHQTVGQQLQGPAFATARRFALGQGCQDGFNLIINFGKAAGARPFAQGKSKSSVDKLTSGTNDCGPTGV